MHGTGQDTAQGSAALVEQDALSSSAAPEGSGLGLWPRSPSMNSDLGHELFVDDNFFNEAQEEDESLLSAHDGDLVDDDVNGQDIHDGFSTNVSMYPRMARGGGASTLANTARVIEVPVLNGIAQWKPRNAEREKISIVKEYFDKMPQGIQNPVNDAGPQHPLLGIKEVTLTMHHYTEVAKMVFGKRMKPVFAFRQLMTYLGIRTKSEDSMKILSFDPEGWNRMGYRLVKGGDRAGGKPFIKYNSI